MKIRMGTFEITDELRLAIGRMYFEPYKKEDVFGNVEEVNEYDGAPAPHTVIQQHLIEHLVDYIYELEKSEVERNKDKYERAHAKTKKLLAQAQKRAERLQKHLSQPTPTTQPKNPPSLEIL